MPPRAMLPDASSHADPLLAGVRYPSRVRGPVATGGYSGPRFGTRNRVDSVQFLGVTSHTNLPNQVVAQETGCGAILNGSARNLSKS